MRRIVTWLASTVTIVVLLFGYHTSTNVPSGAVGSPARTVPVPSTPSSAPSGSSGSASSSPGSTGSAGSGSGGNGPGRSGSAASTASTGSTTPAAQTYPGSVEQTRWGPVQVEITVDAGKVIKVEVPVYPTDNPRDREINGYALPVLVQETIDAQSANIDMVSGATVTSEGYIQSLQSALDDAGL